MSEPPATARLCLHCGLCCNGVLFADVRLQGGDDPARWPGLPVVQSATGAAKLPQPCAAFESGTCRCQIYPDRPSRCRQFDCLLLQRVKRGAVAAAPALRMIAQARRQVARVERLLERLNFNDPARPLKQRYQRCVRAAERGGWTPEQLARLSRLQLAMHHLSSLLAREFLP